MKLQLSELAYKHNTNQLPEVFYYYFRDISTIHNYETRSKTNKNPFLPRVNLNYGQFGVKYAAVKTWNETPDEIRASKSTKVFRKKIQRLPPKPIVGICLYPSGQDSSKPHIVLVFDKISVI